MSIVCQEDRYLKELLRYFPIRMSSSSRRRDVVGARCSISWIAVRELGYSGADVTRYLDVPTPVWHSLSLPSKRLTLMILSKTYERERHSPKNGYRR